MNELSQEDRVVATGITIAIGSVIHTLHNRGVIRCPGIGPDAPNGTFTKIAEDAITLAIEALEDYAKNHPLGN